MKFRIRVAIIAAIGLWNSMLLAETDPPDHMLTGDEHVQSIRLYGIDATSGRAHAAILADDSCYIGGEAWSKATDELNLWLWRIDLASNLLWQKEFSKGSNVLCILPKNSVAAKAGDRSTDGVYVIVRRGGHAEIVFIDSKGNVSQEKRLGGSGFVYGNVMLSGGDFLLFGSSEGNLQRKSHAWISRIGQDGKLRWQKDFHADAAKWSEKIQAARQQEVPKGFHRGDSLYSAAVIEDDSIVLVGQTGEFNKFGQGPSKLWVLRIDGDGKQLAEIFIDDGNVFRGTKDLIAPVGDGVMLTYSVDQLPPIGGAPYNFPPDGFRARLLRLNATLEKQWETLLPSTAMPGATSITGPAPYISVTPTINAAGKHLMVRGNNEVGEELWTSQVSVPNGSARPLSTLRIGNDVLAICNYTSHRKEDRKRMDNVLVVRVQPPAAQ
jgi:hypothetical protein